MRHHLATLAIIAAIGLPAIAAAEPLDLGNMSEEDRAAFREEVRSYLRENPEVILEAIEILEDRRASAAQASDRQMIEARADQLFGDGFSWVAGNPDGDVTIVEFLDYRCGYCKKAHPVVEELLERDGDVRLIVKEFPILGPDSVAAGRMALAALELDAEKFAPLHHALMDFEGNLTDEAAYRLAEEAGYDPQELRSLAESSEIDDRLQQNYQLAQALGLQGTPAFVVGNEIIRGYLPLEQMLGVVREARVAQN